MIVFFVILIFFAILAEALSLRAALNGLRYSVRPSKSTVDPGETFEIISEVTNTHFMPHAYLKLVENLPERIILDHALGEARASLVSIGGETVPSVKVTGTFYLMPKKKHVRRISCHIDHRGRYFLGSAALSGGDFLGLKEVSESFARFCEIVVLPKRAEADETQDALGGFLGDISVRRFIMEDPVLTLGFREYTGREPQKQISWARSVSQGRLMVKNYDYTLEPCITVLLNVEGGENEDKERCFSIARTVCEELEQKGIRYGFMTNAAAAGSIGAWSEIAEGLGERHLLTILEGLGRATYDCTRSCDTLLLSAAMKAEQGRSHILISASGEKIGHAALSRLRELSGSEVLLMQA